MLNDAIFVETVSPRKLNVNGRSEVHLMQDGAAAHRHFFRQKAIAEDRAHRQAQEQILLDRVELGAGGFPLVGEHVLAGERAHDGSLARATLS
jgi:hypothetical protein